MNPIATPLDSLTGLIREGALEALRSNDPAHAQSSIDAAQAAIEGLREEMSKAHALHIVLRLAQAFRDRPEVDAFHVWARSMDFGVCLGQSDGGSGSYKMLSENDRELDPRAAAFYADPENRDPGEDPDSEPHYIQEDYVHGAFHLAFVDMFRHKGPRVEWNFDEGTEWIPRGDALSIADALGMDWMRPWLERTEIHLAAGAADAPATRPRL